MFTLKNLACFAALVILKVKTIQYEPRYEKTVFLDMRKQRRRSASR